MMVDDVNAPSAARGSGPCRRDFGVDALELDRVELRKRERFTRDDVESSGCAPGPGEVCFGRGLAALLVVGGVGDGVVAAEFADAFVECDCE